MLYFSKLRILFITLFSLLFIVIASSNLFKIDDGFFDKKINLGLDLQGGSYLLLEIILKIKISKLITLKLKVKIYSLMLMIKVNK